MRKGPPPQKKRVVAGWHLAALLPPPLLLLLLICCVGTVGAALCPDGSTGLTTDLYEKGPTAYKDVTCIPQRAFSSYSGDITLTGLQFLNSIEDSAFGGDHKFDRRSGKLTITGEYPALETIGGLFGSRSYYVSYGENDNVEDVIAFTGLESLKYVAEGAFRSFGGTLTFTGGYPVLETIGEHAFYDAGNAESEVDLSKLNAATLEVIHYRAFETFQGSVTLPTGPFPKYNGCTRLLG